jgi:hypothetical protein
MFESDLLFLLDDLLEGADGLCSRNFDGEYVAGIIVVDETVDDDLLAAQMSLNEQTE